MNIQELKEFFSTSDYSSETKSAIATILADQTETSPGLVFKIQDILQKELDADFKEFGASLKGNPEGEKIEQEYVEALDIIEKDLSNDLNFVEKELKDLEDISTQVTKASDEIEADKIRQSIQSAM